MVDEGLPYGAVEAASGEFALPGAGQWWDLGLTFAAVLLGVFLGETISRWNERRRERRDHARSREQYNELAKLIAFSVYENVKAGRQYLVAAGGGRIESPRFDLETWDLSKQRFANLCPYPSFMAEVAHFFNRVRIAQALNPQAFQYRKEEESGTERLLDLKAIPNETLRKAVADIVEHGVVLKDHPGWTAVVPDE